MAVRSSFGSERISQLIGGQLGGTDAEPFHTY
jgi:hypothetical protein